ncbi:MAG: T9SS type A sorting domain-containing protein [Candidatus Cloacimonetes bacterium]|nr:T9SS type A sorting domain-containing protein [Candidatus Cloacimonadota bacterium]
MCIKFFARKSFLSFVLIILFLVPVLSAYRIEGKLEFWQKEDFCSFDTVGDQHQKYGDITSVFVKKLPERLFIRVTFDDMAQRQENLLQADRFAQKDIDLKLDISQKSKSKKVFSQSFDLSSKQISKNDVYVLRTPQKNLLEIELEFVPENLSDFSLSLKTFFTDELSDTYHFDFSDKKENRGGNAAFVHHGNQGLTYTEVFYGQDPPETSGFDEVLEVHEATNLPGNFHLSGTLMPAAEWHAPDFNDWLADGVTDGYVAMLTSALGQHIMPFVQNDMNNWSVSTECDMVDYFYDYVPKVAWVPERVWLKPDQYPSAGVNDWLGDNWNQHGVEAVILDDSPHCWNVSSTKIHWMNNDSGINLRVIPINNSFVGNMHYDAGAAKNQINSTGQYDIVVYGTDWEVAAEMNQHHNTMFLDNYESVIWYCHDNYPAINVWKLDAAINNSDFNGTGFDITPGTYGLLGGGDGYGGSNNSWYINWANTGSHSDFHDPQWNYGYIWDNAYNHLLLAPDNEIAQLGWYTLMINLHETGWHSDGQIPGWEHRYSSHMKNANVFTEVSHWANDEYTEDIDTYKTDIDRDGVDELILYNTKTFFVFDEIGGKIQWAFCKEGGNAYSVIGSDVAYWSETDGDYNESSNNHVAGLSDVSPNYQHDIYDMQIDYNTADSVGVTLSKGNISKTVKLNTGESHLDVVYDFSSNTGYVKSGWTPDLLDLIWSGKSHLQRMWGDYGQYCGQRNSSSGATVAYVTGAAGAYFNTQFEGTLVVGDEVYGQGQFRILLYAGLTSAPYDPNNNKVVELDSLAAEMGDDLSPQIVGGAAYKVKDNTAQIIFNEELDEASAENIDNYTLQNFSGSYNLSSAQLTHERKVTLTLEDAFDPGDYGEIVVSNVEDLFGNTISPDYNTASLQAVITPHVVGSMNDWNPGNHDFDLVLQNNGVWQMTTTLAVGTYDYKIVESDSWDNNDWPDENQAFTLDEESEITIYANCGLVIGARNWDEYVFHGQNPPVAVGDFLSEIGGTDWNEQTTLTQMNDDGLEGDETAGDGIYTFMTTMPEGNYEYKIVLNNNWQQNTTEQNLDLNLTSDSDVYFYYNMCQNAIDTEVVSLAVDENNDFSQNSIIKSIYPNPFKQNLDIQLNLKQNGKVVVNLFNIKGQKLSRVYQSELPAGTHVLEMDDNWSRDLSAGLYLLQVKTANHKAYHKVIKLNR